MTCGQSLPLAVFFFPPWSSGRLCSCMGSCCQFDCTLMMKNGVNSPDFLLAKAVLYLGMSNLIGFELVLCLLKSLGSSLDKYICLSIIAGWLWSMWSAMWCLSVDGRLVVHQYLGGGSHLQPLPGCCLILLPPHHPCVMEVEQVLGSSGLVWFLLVCAPLRLASACVWQINHRLCGFVIVIRSLVFMA